MAHGNFDDALTLNPDGTLTVCGPINWDGTPPDLKATAIEITLLVISQRTWGGLFVIGTRTAPAAKFTPAGAPLTSGCWTSVTSTMWATRGPAAGCSKRDPRTPWQS